MDLTRELTEMAKANGASVAGVASVERFDGAPQGHHPRDLLPGAEAVFAFGIRILDRVLEWPDLLQGSPLFPDEWKPAYPGRRPESRARKVVSSPWKKNLYSQGEEVLRG
jgi:hypothetical protein